VRQLTFFAAVLCSLAVLWGQGLTGTISGVVTDPNNAVVPAAMVSARNVETNAVAQTQTDENGYYRFPNLPPGNYVISVVVKGFRKAELSAQQLTVAAALRADVPLQIGEVSETVTVEAAASNVNTENAQLGLALTEIPTLPNISGAGGRNALNLVALQPGVVLAQGSGANSSGSVGGFSVNGMRTQANNYLLDGTDSNDLAINVPDTLGQISPDALQEFRVVTGAMKAEYGRNGGAVIEAITKSGTNAFHGAATEVFRNTVLNATPFFQNVTPGGTSTYFSNGLKRRPQWNTNDFDAQLGGPIRKDRTFFFLDYLGFRRRQGVTSSATVFTPADRAAILASGVPAAVNILGLVPSPSVGNQLFTSPANMLDRDQGMLKIDHRFTERNALAFTWFIEKQTSFDPFAFSGSPIPGFGQEGQTTFTNFVLRDTHSFSASLLNDARMSFHRRAQPGVLPINHTPPASLGFSQIAPDDSAAAGPPWIAITGYSSIGNTIQGPQARYDNTWQWADSISWIHGRHALKFGGDYRAYEQNQQFTFINNGYYIFDGSGTQQGLVPAPAAGVSDPLNDFIHGFATLFVQNSAARQGYRDRFASFFAQDDWKVRPHLTLNLGVRWEYGAPLTELRDRLNAFRPGQQSTVFPDAPPGLVFPGDAGIPRSTYHHDWNNFGPRVGFAWDPMGNGKMSVRAGFGMFYDIPVSELTLQFLTAPPFGVQPNLFSIADITRPYTSSLENPIANPFPFTPIPRGGHFDFSSIAPIGLTVMDPNFKTPYTMQWNFQIQYQFAKDWVLDTTYVGTRGVDLLSRRDINYALVTPTATSLNDDPRRVYNLGNPLDTAFGGAVFGNITDQTSDANSIYNSLQVDLNKRFSHGLQMLHSYTWSHSIDNASGLRVNGNALNARLDRGNSEFDVRHRYTGSLVWDIPGFHDQRSAAGRVLGGWQIAGVIVAQTGFPFDITEPQDRCLCDGGTQRPDSTGVAPSFVDPRTNSFGVQNAYFEGTGGGSATAATNPYFRRVGTGASFAQGAGRFGDLGRNVFHGPGITTVDLALTKRFRIAEQHHVELRGEAFNLLNHTNFNNPSGNIGSSTFGRITSAKDPRLIQLTLRYMF
jgi:Carboxypeptidase regulatory-like domain/TonB-dependent Receptor Plug Domain